MKILSGKDERRLYSDLAWTWPIINPVESYIEETELFGKLIKEHSKIEVKTLLHTDRHLYGIFKLKTWLELLKATGFEVKQMKFITKIPFNML